MGIFLVWGFLLFHIVLLVSARSDARPFISILLACHVYFCIGGYYYWIEYRQLEFVGMMWDHNDLMLGINIMSASTVGVAFIVNLALSGAVERPMANHRTTANRTATIFLYIGGIATLYLVAFGIGRSENSTSDPFLLIAYQFSDCLIPAIVFRFARKPDAKAYFLVALYVVISVFVGFRYKIAIVCIPLIILKIAGSEPFLRKWLHVSFASFAIFILFSAMTLFRVKLGVPDLTRNIGGIDEMLYNFFAESNIIFGMAVVVRNFLDAAAEHFPLSPPIDSVLGLIPRVILPDRKVGVYLETFNQMFLTTEGENSGTAYPFVGEFIIMGGYVGLIAGVIFYSYLYIFLHKKLLKIPLGSRVFWAGIGLLTAEMGYFHYTRGYLPQQFKAYLFIIIPYFMICYSQLASDSRDRSFRPQSRPTRPRS